jgi:hypothetical protein
MALSTRSMIASNSSFTVFWSNIEEPRPFMVFSPPCRSLKLKWNF